MAVKIRLTRFGKKKTPYYRIVVMDSKKSRDGQYLELIGTYAPMLPNESEHLKVDKEKAIKWLKLGAEPTVAVREFLSVAGALAEVDSAKANKKKKSRKAKYNSLADKVKAKEAAKVAKAKGEAAKEKKAADKKAAEATPEVAAETPATNA